MSNSIQSFRARWVIPVIGEPIENGLVRHDGDSILQVGRYAGELGVEDLGDVAVLPALVNSHTHLEFSDLERPLGNSGMVFADWIRSVVQDRTSRGSDNGVKQNAIQNGIGEAERTGTVALGEIVSLPVDFSAYNSPGVETTLFIERLGLRTEQCGPALEALDQAIVEARGRFRLGISPHAPYSTHPKLFEALVDRAIKGNAPVAMHLAETRDELEFLQSGTGPFAELLKGMEIPFGDAISRGSRVLDYLKKMAEARRSLVIHGNYLADDELDWIANHRNE